MTTEIWNSKKTSPVHHHQHIQKNANSCDSIRGKLKGPNGWLSLKVPKMVVYHPLKRQVVRSLGRFVKGPPPKTPKTKRNFPWVFSSTPLNQGIKTNPNNSSSHAIFVQLKPPEFEVKIFLKDWNENKMTQLYQKSWPQFSQIFRENTFLDFVSHCTSTMHLKRKRIASNLPSSHQVFWVLLPDTKSIMLEYIGNVDPGAMWNS